MQGDIRCRASPWWMDNIVEEDNRISTLKTRKLGLKAGPQGNIAIGRSTENITFAARPYPNKPTVPDETRGQEFGDAPAWVEGRSGAPQSPGWVVHHPGPVPVGGVATLLHDGPYLLEPDRAREVVAGRSSDGQNRS
ncbi:hypothetical protein CMUS01_15840 [Colletotrichum musicola]|uniref:Uncharacterized protein n=1 Tax=Colletotrichum musicola TaxID=2175873 RepID=A0A8H6ITZ6_9PEZI|nr:hypothetical protein CMUS01_15840 [Colletotrichum musicola]